MFFAAVMTIRWQTKVSKLMNQQYDVKRRAITPLSSRNVSIFMRNLDGKMLYKSTSWTQKKQYP